MNKVHRVGAIVASVPLLLLALPVAQAVPVTPVEPEVNNAIVAAFTLAAPVGQTESGVIARAIVPGGSRCPTLFTVAWGGVLKRTRMVERKAPVTTLGAFAPLRSCTAPIPAGALQAQVGRYPIPASMPERIDRMVVFGDTGCRLKGSNFQACNDPDQWPLAKNVASIARERPDLILFTGDFFYREKSCPSDLTIECGGSPPPISDPNVPFKDSAAGWLADVFVPMAGMFSVAPIVVTRGNHEECARGGNGYFIYMDPREGTEDTCAPVPGADDSLVVPPLEVTDSYAVDVSVRPGQDLRMAIVDSADGDECEVSDLVDEQRAAYVQAQELAAESDQSWLVVHQPVAAWQPSDECAPGGSWYSADQQVGSYGLLGNYRLMVSSHIHLVQTMNIPGIPPQVVLGNGGTLLEDDTPIPLPTTGPNFSVDDSYPAPTSSWSDIAFGYALVRPIKHGRWLWTMKSPDGTPQKVCTLRSIAMTCRNPI